MVNITIDGIKLEVEENLTILEAARLADIEIPTLCDHKTLTPYGGCRLCVVEVDGSRTLQPSCTLPVAKDMVVCTDSEKVRAARKFVLTMIFSERNHFCPYCNVTGGDCELQNSAYVEGMTHWPIQPNWQPYHVDASHPFIIIEHNRCILCRLCVRACNELVGNFTLEFSDRGANSMLIADLDVPLGESSCIGCGTCVQVCPTGTLIDLWSAYQGREIEVDSTNTICQGCSIGCSIDVLTRDNRLVRIEGDWDGEINGGVSCDVGRFLPMIEDRERVMTPQVRLNGSLISATLEEALKTASDKMKQSGKNTAAVASTRLSLESLNAFKAMCEQLGITKITSTEEGSSTSAAYNLLEESGKPFESKFADVKDADCFLVFGEDITKDHQVVSFFVKRALPAGVKLIQISDTDIGLDNFADFSLNVKTHKIADFLSVLAAMVSSRSTTDLKALSKEYGLDEETLQKVSQTLSNAAKPMVIAGTRFDFDDQLKSLKSGLRLAEAINGKFITTKGNINSMGAAQLGMNSPIDVSDAEVVFLAVGDEKLNQQFIKKFDNVPYLIVMSSYVSPLTAAADVVIPVANWLEQSGHFLNFDGNILEAKAALTASAGIYSNFEMFEKIAGEMDLKIASEWENTVREQPSVVLIS